MIISANSYTHAKTIKKDVRKEMKILGDIKTIIQHKVNLEIGIEIN